jgi:hypothetical protein
LPHLSSLGGRARAAASPVRRLIVIYVPQQETEGFLPQGEPLSLAGGYLEPLAPFFGRMLWVHNMRGRSGHMEGHTEALTGHSATAWRPPGGPSIDQYIAGRLGTATPLPSLELTGSSPSETNKDWGVVAWTDKVLPVQPIADPRRAFERAFASVPATNPGAAAAAQAAAEVGRRHKLQKSLLDALISDYQRVSGAVGAGDRQLLDAHLTLLREQEQRLQKAAVAPPPPAACEPGAAPAANVDPKEFPARIRHHMDTIIGAVRCDSTRVFTLMLGVAQDGREYTWVGNKDNFHSVAHGDAPNYREQHFAARKWQAQQIAHLLQGLDGIKEGDRTALDNSVVAWIGELGYYPWSAHASGRHLRNQVSAVLMGGCGGYFAGGRVVDVKQADQANLLITLAHAMGYADLTAFGKNGAKALAELRA